MRNIQPWSDSEHKFITIQSIILHASFTFQPSSDIHPSYYFVIHNYIRNEIPQARTYELIKKVSKIEDSVIRLQKLDTVHFNINFFEFNYKTINQKK